MKKIKIAILGLGTVGGGVAHILKNNSELIKNRMSNLGTDMEFELVKIFGRSEPSCDELKSIFTKNIADIISDDSIDVVIETIGGVEPATSYMLDAMKAKKHVITANKAAIAKAGGKLEQTANDNGVVFLYEAAVAGTIPVIQGIKYGLVANNIKSIRGILNGTTNYIITSMRDDKVSFDDALKVAQELGYAEADPSSDVDGFDVMYKLAILCYTAYGKYPNLDDIKLESLRNIKLEDIEAAKNRGNSLKYIAKAELNSDDKLDLSVSVQEIDSTDALYGVDGVLNAVSVECDMAGTVMFKGAGAGSKPTASAVVSDLVQLALMIK